MLLAVTKPTTLPVTIHKKEQWFHNFWHSWQFARANFCMQEEKTPQWKNKNERNLPSFTPQFNQNSQPQIWNVFQTTWEKSLFNNGCLLLPPLCQFPLVSGKHPTKIWTVIQKRQIWPRFRIERRVLQCEQPEKMCDRARETWNERSV